MLGKVDDETGEKAAMGGATLKGAQFEVTYYDVEGQTNQDGVNKDVVDKIAAKAKTTKKWVFETDEDGFCYYTSDYKISGDDLYKQTNGTSYALPIGTVVIREIKAPTGYLNSNENKYWIRSIKSDNATKEKVDTYDAPDEDTAFKEQVMRANMSFSKKLEGESDVGAYIPFLMTSKKTGESHEQKRGVNTMSPLKLKLCISLLFYLVAPQLQT